MATLSGNKIKNTYQALVKFSDNGNITTSAKQLTDGFGNNSPMWVSTTQVGIGVTPESGLNLHVYGDAKIGSNLTVIGNLVVEGSTTTVGTDTLTVKDPLIVLANNNTSTDAVDIGFYGKYTPSGTTLYSGLFREALTGKYRLFKGLQIEPTTTVSISGTGYDKADLVIGNIETNGVVEDSSLFTFSKDVIINKAGTTKLTIDNVTQNKSIELECTSLNNVLNAEGDMIFSSGSPIFKYTSSSFEVLSVESTFGGDVIANNTITATSYIQTDSNFLAKGDIKFRNNADTSWNAGQIGTDSNDSLRFAVKTAASSNVEALTLDANLKANFTGSIAIGGNATTIASFVTESDTIASNDNDTTLPTSAAVKDYVDTQVGANNELSEVLANGNTTGGTDIVITAGDKITNFTSTGIDDNATSNVLELDSVGNAIFEKSSGAFLMLKDSSTVRASINVTNNDDLIFSTTSSYTTALTIDSDQDATFAGNVLLSGYLSVEGTTGNTGGATDRWIGGDGTAGTWFYNVPTGSSHLFGINNSNILTLNGTGATFAGNVDINGNLDVTSTASDAVFLRSSQATTTNVYITNTNATANNTANLFFAPANNVAGSYIKSTAIEDFSTSANRTSDLRFAVRKDGTFNEALIIDSDGNVGIGGSASTFANFTNVTIQGGSSGSNLDFKNSSGTRVSAIVTTASNELIIETGTAQPIIFKTNDTERMRIESTGVVKFPNTATSTGDVGTIAHYTNNYMYIRGGTSGLAIGDDGFDTSIYLNNSDSIQFQTGGSEKMRITSGARINMDVMAGQASEGVIRIGRYDANASRYNEIQNSVTSTGAGSYMNLSVHSGTENVVTDVMTLLGNGNVGIGGGTIEGKLSIDYTAAELPTSGTTSNSAIQVTSSLNNQLNLGLNTVSGRLWSIYSSK